MGDAEGARGGFAEPLLNLSGKQDHYATYLWTSEEMALAIMCCVVVSFFNFGGLMSDFEIVTNNPAVVGAHPEAAKFYRAGVIDIFTIVRDRVHQGAKVLSHPLSGSIKPWETPYKSIVVSRLAESLDFESLKHIENAIGMMKNRSTGSHAYSAEVLEGFSVIDLDIINSAINSIERGDLYV